MRVLIVFGTRPEAIKLYPVIQELRDRKIPHHVCNTGQHAKMLDDLLEAMSIKVDISLKLHPQPSLNMLLGKILQLLPTRNYTSVIVQGDTTSALAAALAGFNAKIPVFHVEAGLRTFNMNDPFPEEMNRVVIDKLSTLCFAPTEIEHKNLVRSGCDEKQIVITGNTVADGLRIFGCTQFLENDCEKHKTVLLTMHRRETIESGRIHAIFKAIHSFLLRQQPSGKKYKIKFPMHPNPKIQKAVDTFCWNELSIEFMKPIAYLDLLEMYRSVDAVVTDSGGIVEETSSLGIPTLIIRNVLDRPSALHAPLTIMTGTTYESVTQGLSKLKNMCGQERIPTQIFGDGHAARYIVDAIVKRV